MKFICALITVSDMQRSRYFYETLLEQKVKVDYGQNITFHGDFALHLSSHFQELIDNKPIKSGGNNFELYFEQDNLELLVERLKNHTISFVHPLREQPWRQQVVRFYDPDDHIIEVGESMEHLSFRLHLEGSSIQQIATITYLPEEVVKQSIEKFSIIS